MAHEGLRLSVAASETHRDSPTLEGLYIDRGRHREGGIQRKERSGSIEIARRNSVGVLTHERFEALMHQSGHMHPTKLMDGRVNAGIRRFLRVLSVVAGMLELQFVVDVIGLLALRL